MTNPRLDYSAPPAGRRWFQSFTPRRVFRLVALVCSLLALTWISVPIARLFVAHLDLKRHLATGDYQSNADAQRDLVPTLRWSESLPPLLKAPCRSDVRLYYPNGYAIRTPRGWRVKLH